MINYLCYSKLFQSSNSSRSTDSSNVMSDYYETLLENQDQRYMKIIGRIKMAWNCYLI